jgi:hypothetical protein
MNAKQPCPCPKGRKPADPPPPPKSGFSKYKLPEEVSFADFTMYHSCYTTQSFLSQRCKNNCSTCLYRNSSKICIADIAREIMKNIERKYGVDEEGE